jgi:hypothetical protein
VNPRGVLSGPAESDTFCSRRRDAASGPRGPFGTGPPRLPANRQRGRLPGRTWSRARLGYLAPPGAGHPYTVPSALRSRSPGD